jgi:hypothetical protein
LFAHHQLRPSSTRPFVGLPCSAFTRSRSAQRPSIFASIRSSKSSAGGVGIGALRDNSFPGQLCGMVKHHLTVAGEVFGTENRVLDVAFTKKIQQCLLALYLRHLAKVAIRQRRSKA